MKSLLLLTLLSLQSLFAIISIVPVEIGDAPGISGKLELALDTQRGNTHKDNYSLGAVLSYDNNSSYVLWTELSGEYGKANHVEDTNKIYSHIRYLYALTDNSIRAEAFLQTEEDQFKSIAKRRLTGFGLRFKLFETFSNGKGYCGFAPIYEYIRYIDPTINPKENNIRLNTYLAYTVQFAEDSTFSYTLYYQPLVSKISDHVIANKLELQLHIYLKLFLKFSVYYDVDSVQPVGLEQDYDFRQTTSFVLNF